MSFTKFAQSIFLYTAVLTSGCSAILGQRTIEAESINDAKFITQFKDPGHFDIGAGFTVLKNTADGRDARGTLVSFKAYPTGRWYTQAKAPGIKDVISESESKSEEDSKGKHSTTSLLEANKVLVERQSTGFYVVPERDKFYHRFSFFYGISAGNFSGGDLDSQVNAFGIGYDIAPEFSIITGVGFYDYKLPSETEEDSDSAFLFGVSLNLNAFTGLLKAAGQH